jgi:hypothetical protein
MDVARLNFSHGSPSSTRRPSSASAAQPTARGGRWPSSRISRGRSFAIGPVRDGIVELDRGSTLTLCCGGEEEGDGSRLSVSGTACPAR